MVNRRSSPNREGKRYNFQLSFNSLLLLSVSLLFLFAWVFSLGIMVGRGFIPSNPFSIKEEVPKEEKSAEIDRLRPIREEELSFYNELVDKKESTKKEVLSRPILKDKSTKAEKPRKEPRGYSVQVAALKDREKTEELVGRLTRLGYPAYYHHTLIDGEVYYRIRCGPFPTMEEVRRCAKRLTDEQGFEPFIVYPSKID